MPKLTTILSAAALSAAIATGASAATVEFGSNTFDNGWASWIRYDDSANRGTLNDRDNPANALGSDASSFFEIGFGSQVELKFGSAFTSPGTLIEVTNGSTANWPESVDIYVGNDGDAGSFNFVGSMSNASAQNPGGAFTFAGGPFDTVRLIDTSSFPATGSGGWDIAAVRVAAVPLPAALPLLAAGLGAFGFVARRKRRASKA
jgi:hypothetical protein